MQLHPLAREYYALTIATDDDVTGWQASFDHGTTWHAGDTSEDDGRTRWLLAGPDADTGDAIVISASVVPLVRAIDNPEIIVRKAPRVTVT